jgi:hypothetical protein
MPKRQLSPLNTFIIPELRPERTAADLARRWPGASAEKIAREIARGTDDEMEHTPFRYIARIIASHHLWKKLDYYKKGD